MRRLAIVATLFVVMIVVTQISISASTPAYPTIIDLENQLNMHPGDALPRLIQYRGRIFQPYYVRAEELSSGEYSIVVKLR